LGLAFEIIPSDIPEIAIEGETNEAFVKRLAEWKALGVAEKRREALVIGADTIVALGSLRLGKPASKEEARKMLEMLSGKKHEVLTGVAVISLESSFRKIEVEKTAVWIKKLTSAQIDEYVETPEPYDKAGGYGIQGRAAAFIEKIEGDRTNVIGLPLVKCARLLEKAGLIFTSGCFQPDLTAQGD
jgi:septum formation protein